ncbi:hypothetical protein [Agrobacterium larrymoorei]|uniref:WD40 repeat domain-containing protein n=1 Tax=Agrobacterium larrymoorei TaxID=160699 RepID=A0ABU0UDX6_9HYPH|nr:hypothetical protein [Agrobacterium larrymoorei]MDQ1183146.1 hypothetical protein [Agrobacterium larrymoorei]
MNDKEKYLGRVKSSADGLAGHLRQNSNVPLDELIDVSDLRAMSDALSLDPESVNERDLVTIHIVRDALHETLARLSDSDSDEQYSVEQLLNTVSRLYVDVERLLRVNSQDIENAGRTVEQLSSGQHKAVSKELIAEVADQANSIITHVQVNPRIININILNFSARDVNLIKDFRMNVKRLSASVFAIKLNFESLVVFEGTIRFLNEGVDKIISDIKDFADLMERKYSDLRDFINSLTPVIEKGTRFVKFIGKVIRDLFERDEHLQSEIVLKKQSATNSEALTCAALAPNGDVLFGGRAGTTLLHVGRTGQFIKLPKAVSSDIFRIAALPGDRGFVAGTAEGMAWVEGVSSNRRYTKSSFSENITALAVLDHENEATGLISGSSSGYVRRWTLSGGLDAYRDPERSRPVHAKVGKAVRSVESWEKKLVIAVDERVVVINENLDQIFEVHVDKPISAMCLFPDDSAVVTGAGLLAEVNLAKGAYNRLLTVNPTVNYICVAHLTNRTAVVGTEDGIIRAIDMNSGAEVGEIRLGVQIRGLVVQNKTIFAYGGKWKSDGNSVIKILWDEIFSS